MASGDLFGELIALCEGMDGPADRRFAMWARRVDGVDASCQGVYAFPGEWLDSGRAVSLSGPALFMVGITRGDRRCRATTYRFILVDDDGALRDTGIVDTSDVPGWEARVREPVRRVLDGLTQPSRR